jgi:hypothetical protein
VIDPSLFTVERLLAAMLDDIYGNIDAWRKDAEILPQYMPPSPQPDTCSRCVVRHRSSFLRYSKGPRQGCTWDLYGDDFVSPEQALLALLQAPVPPSIVRWSDDADALMRKVRERIGAFGRLAIASDGNAFSIDWRRSYNGALSDFRSVDAPTLSEALEAVLRWEDEADAEDARRKGTR